jgi:molybdenum cofactor cytidylyltransferase
MASLSGIVLAAGLSSRMGQAKQLLPLGDRTVLQWVVDTALEDVSQIVVVVGHQADLVKASLADYPVDCVFNPNYLEGMLSSVRVGMAAAKTDAFMLFLGDQPSVGRAAVGAVVEQWRHSGKGLVIPTRQGKRGHPVLISAKYHDAINSIPAGLGLNSVTRAYPEDTVEVEVAASGVVEDLDTPLDYRQELERRGLDQGDAGQEK